MFLLRMCEPTTKARFREMIDKQRQTGRTPRTYRMTIDRASGNIQGFRYACRVSMRHCLTEAVLEKFRNHFSRGRSGSTTGQRWVNKLIDWLKRENVPKQERPMQSAQNRSEKNPRATVSFGIAASHCRNVRRELKGPTRKLPS